jgi:hypothetical protein
MWHRSINLLVHPWNIHLYSRIKIHVVLFGLVGFIHQSSSHPFSLHSFHLMSSLTDGCSNIYINTWKCVWWVDNAHPSMNQILSIIEFHPMDHINDLIVQHDMYRICILGHIMGHTHPKNLFCDWGNENISFLFFDYYTIALASIQQSQIL